MPACGLHDATACLSILEHGHLPESSHHCEGWQCHHFAVDCCAAKPYSCQGAAAILIAPEARLGRFVRIDF